MRRVSVDEAAIVLGLSVSSVRRRIRAGTLTVEREATPAGFRYAVVLPDAADYSPPSQPPTQTPATDYAPPSHDEQVAALIEERDWLRRRIEELTTLLSREQETVLRLTSQAPSQRLLSGLVTPTQPPGQVDRRPERGFVATVRRLIRQIAYSS